MLLYGHSICSCTFAGWPPTLSRSIRVQTIRPRKAFQNSGISALVLEHLPWLDDPPARLSSFALPLMSAEQPLPLYFSSRAVPRAGNVDDDAGIQGWKTGQQGQANPEHAAGQAHSSRRQCHLQQQGQEQEQQDHFYARSRLLINASLTLATLCEQVSVGKVS